MKGKRSKAPEPPPEFLEIWQDFHDHAKFARESLTIRDKRGVAVPMELKPAQIKLHAIIEECRRRRRPVRIIVLKARQVMVSTAVAGEYFHEVPFKAGQQARIIAHNEDSAKLIYGYYHQFFTGYKPFRGVAHLPVCTKDAEDAGELHFEGGSKFQIQTARSVEGGRGGSFRYLHLSEYAFWPSAERLMRGLLQSVPDDSDTMIVIESTANGVGNDFHKRWVEASDPNNAENEWIPFFFAWWEHPEYRFPVENPVEFQNSLSDEEIQLRDRFSLSLEQLAWRRWAIKNKCKGSLDTFKQEYPSEPNEAFLFSGRPRFHHQSLARMPVIADPPVGELEEIQQGPKKQLIWMPSDDGRGALTVFRKPVPGHRYSIGVDVAEGIDVGEGELGSIDPDYSVADVIDCANGEQVAQLRGRIEPWPFGQYVYLLGQWFNWAFITPEVNGPGLAFLDSLLQAGYPPSLIYHRNPTSDEQYADQQGNVRQKLGWKTTQVTRLNLISYLDAAIRKFDVIIRHAGTVSECQTFIHKPNGKVEHTEKCHDDRVFSIALAAYGMQYVPLDTVVRDLQKRANGPGQPLPTRSQGGTVTEYGNGRLPDRGITIKF